MARLIKYIKLCKSLTFFYYYVKIIGLCPFSIDRNGILKYSHSGVLYSTGLSFIYSIIFIQGMIERSEIVIPNQTIMYKISEELVVILQCTMVIVSWLVFAFRQRKLQKIVNDIKNTNDIAKELKMLNDYTRIIRIFVYYILFLNICFFTLFTLTMVLYNTFPNFNVTLWTLFNFPHIVFHNVLGIFVIAMQIMQWRFHRLNLQLRNLPVRNFEFR